MNDKSKKKILLILYVFFPFENANTNVMLPILDQMNQNYDVDILTCDLDGGQPMEDTYRGRNRVYRFRNARRTFQRKVASHLFQIINPIRRETYEDEAFYRRLEELCRKNQYDMIISQTSPFSPQWVVYLLYQRKVLSHQKTKWIAYFTDPHAAYIGFQDSGSYRFEEERRVYEEADRVVVTPDQYWSDNMKPPYRNHLGKTFSIPLANIFPEKFAGVSPYSFDGGVLHCLYTGSLQDLTVRDPTYFLKIVRSISSRSEYRNLIYFDLVVNNVNPENAALLDMVRDFPNVTLYPRLSLDTCLSMMAGASCLINVGNRCLNQLPSKVADYASAGKPIINFYDQDRDTSKSFLTDYPLTLNIRNKEEINAADVNSAVRFVRENADRCLPPGQVRSLFSDRCADRVAQYAEDMVREVLQE